MEDLFGNVWIFLLLLVSIPFAMWCFYIWIYEVLIKGLCDWMNPSRVNQQYKDAVRQITHEDEYLAYEDLMNQQEEDRQKQIEDQKKEAKIKLVRQSEWSAFNKVNK